MIWVPNSSKHKKRQRVVRHIWTTRWFQRYQADTVELNNSLTEEGKFNYILIVNDYFSKYAWVYPLVSKHSELIRDKLTSVFIIGHPDILHTEKGKDFWNKNVDNFFLENKELIMCLELHIIHKAKVRLNHLINTFKIDFIKHTIIYQNLMKRKTNRVERNMDFWFNDKQFFSWLQLKKKAYNNRMYP